MTHRDVITVVIGIGPNSPRDREARHQWHELDPCPRCGALLWHWLSGEPVRPGDEVRCGECNLVTTWQAVAILDERLAVDGTQRARVRESFRRAVFEPRGGDARA